MSLLPGPTHTPTEPAGAGRAPPKLGIPPWAPPSCLQHPRAAPHPKAPGAWAET